MAQEKTVPKAVSDQMALWGRLGGLARRKRLTIIQRKTIARNAGIASGKARRNGS